MILPFLKKRRRQKILENPIPEQWEAWLRSGVWQYRLLDREQAGRLRNLTQIFVAEKNWEGCKGVQVTDEMKVIIAGMASLLVVGLAYDEHFDHVQSVLIYPQDYSARHTRVLGTGTVIEGLEDRVGEAWYRGPVILAWSDVLETVHRRGFGRNVVLHEFAHQLDMLNGRVADGQPVLPTRERLDRWQSVMQPAFEQLQEDCQSDYRDIIDCYGATSPAEFFAVVTEVFFEAAVSLRQWHPDIYAEMRDFYGLDTATWGNRIG